MTGIKFKGDGPFEVLAQSGKAFRGTDAVTLGFRLALPEREDFLTLHVALTVNQATELLGSLNKAIQQSGSESLRKGSDG